jgi:hypothetical protein
VRCVRVYLCMCMCRGNEAGNAEHVCVCVCVCVPFATFVGVEVGAAGLVVEMTRLSTLGDET